MTLKAGYWPRVKRCRARMEEMDKNLLRGRCNRVRVIPTSGGIENPHFFATLRMALRQGPHVDRGQSDGLF